MGYRIVNDGIVVNKVMFFIKRKNKGECLLSFIVLVYYFFIFIFIWKNFLYFNYDYFL